MGESRVRDDLRRAFCYGPQNLWRRDTMNRGRSLLEWSKPEAIILLIGLPVLLLYGVLPASSFITAYSTVKLLATPWPLLYLLVLLSLLALAARWGGLIAGRIVHAAGGSTRMAAVPPWYFALGLLSSLAAYMIWISMGLVRAGGIAGLMQTYFADPYYVKQVLLETLPGVTTFTQVAVLAIPMLIAQDRGRIHAIHKLAVTLIVLFAVVRSFLHSERLGLLELILPAAFVYASGRKYRPLQLAALLLSALLLVVLFFILNESRRTFVYQPTSNLLTAGMVHFAGYFVTSANNAVLAITHMNFGHPLYWTFQTVWRFPGMGPDSYATITGIQPFEARVVLPAFDIDPSFRTLSALGTWVDDFGLVGALLAATAFGITSGLIHRLAHFSRIFLALYSVWLVGLLDFMLTDYFVSTRLFPAYAFWLGGVFLVVLAQRRVADRRALRVVEGT